MTAVIPKRQVIYNTRKYQKTSEFSDSSNAGIYLSRYLNNLLRALVEAKDDYNGKIIGCDPFFHNLIFFDDKEIFKVLISPGKLIVDSTLIEIEEPVYLDVILQDFKYNEVVVICYFKYNTSKKLTFSLFLRDNANGIINRSIDYDNYIVLGRFTIKRDLDNKIIKISHPYGEWRTGLYPSFLLSIDPAASIVTPLNLSANKIYTLLESDSSLYYPFKINDKIKSIIIPLFLEADNIIKYKNGKNNSRYLLSDLGGFYSLKNDINLRYRMDILT